MAISFSASMLTIRQSWGYATLSLFFVFFLYYGLHNEIYPSISSVASNGIPDFARYKVMATLSADMFPMDDPGRRIIIVGDIHGMNQSLHSLLDKVSYNSNSDVLIHVGDIIAKGTHNESLAVLSYMTSNNITGVRGNHDQKIIEWRGWLDWIEGRSGAKRWFELAEKEWHKAEAKGVELEKWVDKQRKKSNNKLWRLMPKDWIIFSDHYRIARSMTESQYAYLLALPLKLHIPSAHTYIVHAGLLSSDPRYPSTHRRQPLTRIPSLVSALPQAATPATNDTKHSLRRLQELSILSQVPQNRDPWVVLNMRSINNEEVTRSKEGVPWSNLWQGDMSRCHGFEHEIPLKKDKNDALVCYPATVIYGHAASRGLDVKRWSIGLDCGCVYQRKLTALVLGSSGTAKENDVDSDNDDSDNDNTDDTEVNRKKKTTIPFGDNSVGRIVSVKCN